MNKLLLACLTFALLGAVAESRGSVPLPGQHQIQALIDRHNREMNEMTQFESMEPRHDWTVPIMIAKAGYPGETHTIITEDCYIMEMHRIPYGKHSPIVPGVQRPAVLLQHGLLCSSADWIMASPDKSLGFILADAGYDVWMGNYRGNTYGRQHCDLNPDRDDFWHFSWDDMGTYDIPAMIDKIMLTTGQEKIHYVGHSMGTTGFMVMNNRRPEYNDKIIMANLLAPVAYVEHMESPIRLFVPFLGAVDWVTEHLGLGEFLPSSWLMDLLADTVCNIGWLDEICSSVMFLLCGFDEAQLNDTMLETITHHTPAGSSTRSILHYAQEVASGGFNAYDHGKKDNNEIYGQDDPPAFDLNLCTVPTSLYWSQNDWLADPADILSLITRLPNIYDSYEVPFEKWNHLDYLWGIDANTLVYNVVLENMAKTGYGPNGTMWQN